MNLSSKHKYKYMSMLSLCVYSDLYGSNHKTLPHRRMRKGTPRIVRTISLFPSRIFWTLRDFWTLERSSVRLPDWNVPKMKKWESRAANVVKQLVLYLRLPYYGKILMTRCVITNFTVWLKLSIILSYHIYLPVVTSVNIKTIKNIFVFSQTLSFTQSLLRFWHKKLFAFTIDFYC